MFGLVKKNKIIVQGFELSCGDRIVFKNKWYYFLKSDKRDDNKSPIWKVREGKIFDLSNDGKYIGIKDGDSPYTTTDYYDTSDEASEIKILSIL